jgi:hypothetical protein
MSIAKQRTQSEDYQSGWADGYDSNEEEWAQRTMVIARKLLDRVDAESVGQRYLDMEAIEAVTLAFWQYAEHGWVVDMLDQYINWCELYGNPRDMKRLMELKMKGRIDNA